MQNVARRSVTSVTEEPTAAPQAPTLTWYPLSTPATVTVAAVATLILIVILSSLIVTEQSPDPPAAGPAAGPGPAGGAA
eukprot:2442754-Rhodomonas_salina.2